MFNSNSFVPVSRHFSLSAKWKSNEDHCATEQINRIHSSRQTWGIRMLGFQSKMRLLRRLADFTVEEYGAGSSSRFVTGWHYSRPGTTQLQCFALFVII